MTAKQLIDSGADTATVVEKLHDGVSAVINEGVDVPKRLWELFKEMRDALEHSEPAAPDDDVLNQEIAALSDAIADRQKGHGYSDEFMQRVLAGVGGMFEPVAPSYRDEKPLPPDSAAVQLADKLATEVDAVFRRGGSPSTRDEVMELLKHFHGVLSEHEREREASKKRVDHLASLMKQVLLPFSAADYARAEKVAAVKLAFHNLTGGYLDDDEEVPF